MLATFNTLHFFTTGSETGPGELPQVIPPGNSPGDLPRSFTPGNFPLGDLL